MGNPYARANYLKTKAQKALDEARLPTTAYYVVSRDLWTRACSGAWLDLVSMADLEGATIHHVRKLEIDKVPVPAAHALVYQGPTGAITLARQNW